MKAMLIICVVTAALATTTACADEDFAALYPEEADPFMGDWKGLWLSGEDKHPNLTAQVIPLGNNEYEVILAEVLYQRVPPKAVVIAVSDGDVMRFDDGEHFGEISGDRFTGGRRGEKEGVFELERFHWVSPTLGAEPPEDAIVLFDGTGFEEWARFPFGKGWDLREDGVMQANPDLGYLETRRKFRDCRLHIEFRTPYLPEERGQSRANSGVFMQRYFEIQILDSYGQPGYWNECGAIYQIAAPCINMCLPPLQWQTFDIEFRAGRFDADGTLVENPRMTVVHNGVVVHHEVKMPRGTSGHAESPPVSPPEHPDIIRLQAHRNRVQFRNIWVVDLAEED